MNMQLTLTLTPLPSPNNDMITIADANGLIGAAVHIDLFFHAGDPDNVVYNNLRVNREVTVSLTAEDVR